MTDTSEEHRIDPDVETLEEYPQRSDGHELEPPKVQPADAGNPQVERRLIAAALAFAAFLALVLGLVVLNDGDAPPPAGGIVGTDMLGG